MVISDLTADRHAEDDIAVAAFRFTPELAALHLQIPARADQLADLRSQVRHWRTERHIGPATTTPMFSPPSRSAFRRRIGSWWTDDRTRRTRPDRRHARRSPTARIIGEVDASNAVWVAAQLTSAADASSTLNIDRTAVAYLDSQGMRVLQALADHHVQGSLLLTFLVDVPSLAHTLLIITGIDQTVPIRSPSRPNVDDERGAGIADDRHSQTRG